MSICDVCMVELGGDSKRFSSDEVKKAVEKGFRPPADQVDLFAARNFGPDSKKFMETRWVEQVMDDSSDWLLCPACGGKLEAFLPKGKKQGGFFGRIFKK